MFVQGIISHASLELFIYFFSIGRNYTQLLEIKQLMQHWWLQGVVMIDGFLGRWLSRLAFRASRFLHKTKSIYWWIIS